MTARGWSSEGLRRTDDDHQQWTVREACVLLGPPQLTERQLRGLIHEKGLEPTGMRRVTPKYQRGGRPARTYQAADLIALFEDLAMEGL